MCWKLPMPETKAFKIEDLSKSELFTQRRALYLVCIWTYLTSTYGILDPEPVVQLLILAMSLRPWCQHWVACSLCLSTPCTSGWSSHCTGAGQLSLPWQARCPHLPAASLTQPSLNLLKVLWHSVQSPDKVLLWKPALALLKERCKFDFNSETDKQDKKMFLS